MGDSLGQVQPTTDESHVNAFDDLFGGAGQQSNNPFKQPAQNVQINFNGPVYLNSGAGPQQIGAQPSQPNPSSNNPFLQSSQNPSHEMEFPSNEFPNRLSASKPPAKTLHSMEEKSLRKLEPYFSLIDGGDHFKVVCTNKDDHNMNLCDDVLLITKKQARMLTRKRQPDDLQGRFEQPTYGIIGLMNVFNYIFIVLITDKENVGKLPYNDFVYRIKQVDFVPFSKNFTNFRQIADPEILRHVTGIKHVLENQGFYFSYHADITSSYQKQFQTLQQIPDHKDMDLYTLRNRMIDQRYMFNYRITSDFRY